MQTIQVFVNNQYFATVQANTPTQALQVCFKVHNLKLSGQLVTYFDSKGKEIHSF